MMPALEEADARGRSDAELLSAVAAGDLAALGELFDRYEPGLRRYLCRVGQPGADVDDLVQDTFLEITRAAPRFDGERAGRAWIYGVATILLRRRRKLLRGARERISAWAGFGQRAPATPAELFERDEAARRFERAFYALSEKKREVFVLVTLEGLSGEEAAQVLGVPTNTVWTRLYHARLELRAGIEAEAP
jgi:RNA polymerase sigma-70 factor (ECF subfamily)